LDREELRREFLEGGGGLWKCILGEKYLERGELDGIRGGLNENYSIALIINMVCLLK
jgi:hypothetical protein